MHFRGETNCILHAISANATLHCHRVCQLSHPLFQILLFWHTGLRSCYINLNIRCAYSVSCYFLWYLFTLIYSCQTFTTSALLCISFPLNILSYLFNQCEGTFSSNETEREIQILFRNLSWFIKTASNHRIMYVERMSQTKKCFHFSWRIKSQHLNIYLNFY